MSDKTSYRELERALTSLVSKLELGDYENLEDMLTDHKKATEIISELERRLKAAQQKIEKVINTNE